MSQIIQLSVNFTEQMGYGQLLQRVYKYLDDIATHMVLHATFGTVFDPKSVKSYYGNFPQFYPKLTYFKCGKKCRNIPKCYSLQTLDVEDTKVWCIPNLPNLKFLNIQDTRVKRLPFLPRLETLYCDRNKISINLHRFPRLTNFNGIKVRR